MNIRYAEKSDAPAVDHILSEVWSDKLDGDSFAFQVESDEAAVYVAIEDGIPVGVLSCFLTAAYDGTRRWEVDLLAVLPQYRRRGIGRQLIGAAWEDVLRLDAAFARALIATDNKGSQRAFEWAWYHADPKELVLLVWDALKSEDGETTLESDISMVEVHTLLYDGYWVEDFDPAVYRHEAQEAHIRHARKRASNHGLRKVGLIIPSAKLKELAPSLRESAHEVGRYQWWRRERI